MMRTMAALAILLVPLAGHAAAAGDEPCIRVLLLAPPPGRQVVLCQHDAGYSSNTVLDPCQGGVGVIVHNKTDMSEGLGACVFVTVSEEGPPSSHPPCPDGTNDLGIHTGDTIVAVCYSVENEPAPGTLFDIDLDPCPQGVDPYIVILGNGVRICIVVVIQPGHPVDVDLSPCETGFDPSVTVLGIRTEVCTMTVANLPDWGVCPLGAWVQFAGMKVWACDP